MLSNFNYFSPLYNSNANLYVVFYFPNIHLILHSIKMKPCLKMAVLYTMVVIYACTFRKLAV